MWDLIILAILLKHLKTISSALLQNIEEILNRIVIKGPISLSF